MRRCGDRWRRSSESGDADGVAVPGPGEDHAEVVTVRRARDVDVAHDLAGLVGFEPGLGVVQRGEGVPIAGEGEVDALIAGFFEVGEDDGRVGGGSLGVERSDREQKCSAQNLSEQFHSWLHLRVPG